MTDDAFARAAAEWRAERDKAHPLKPSPPILPAQVVIVDPADDLRLEAVSEAAKLAEHFASLAVEAAEAHDRVTLKMRLCMASRALRSALETFATLDGPT
jgi:hypothetical protein